MTEIISNVNSRMRDHLFQAFVSEGQNYRFSDRTGTTIEPHTVAPTAIEIVLMQWKQQPEQERQAVLILEGIADYVLARYNVNVLGRRQQQRRVAAG
jgi:hypothetical protein